MKFYKKFSYRFLLGGIVFFALAIQANAFEYLLEKTFLKNPMLVKQEMSLHVEKDNNDLKINIYKTKFNITLNTIKFTLNVLKNKEITNLHYNNTLKLLKIYDNSIKNNVTSLDEGSLEKLKEKTQRANTALKLQKEAQKQAINSFERYTKNKYKATNILQKLNEITIPENYEKAYSLFKKQPSNVQKAVLKIFVVEDIKNQLIAYYAENTKYRNEQQDFLNQKIAVSANIKKMQQENKNNIDIFDEQEKLTHIEKQLIILKYNLLFQKSKISFAIGNLLKNIKKKEKLDEPTITRDTPKIVTAMKSEPKKKKIAKSKKKKNPFHHTKLKRIHFVSNMVDVSSYSIDIVERNAELLNMMKDYNLELYGHSDSFGTKEENYNLGLQRAIKTKEALVKFGANPNKIKVFSLGDTKPIASNKTKKGRLLNRRVEFKLIEEK